MHTTYEMMSICWWTLSKHWTFTLAGSTVPFIHLVVYFNSRLEFSHIHFVSYQMLGTYSLLSDFEILYARKIHTPNSDDTQVTKNYSKRERLLTCAFVWQYSIRIYYNSQCVRVRARAVSSICVRITFLNYFISTGFRLYALTSTFVWMLIFFFHFKHRL